MRCGGRLLKVDVGGDCVRLSEGENRVGALGLGLGVGLFLLSSLSADCGLERRELERVHFCGGADSVARLGAHVLRGVGGPLRSRRAAAVAERIGLRPAARRSLTSR